MNPILDTIGYLFGSTSEHELADMGILPSPLLGAAFVFLVSVCGIAAMGGGL